MKLFVFALLTALSLMPACKAETNINPTLREIIEANGGCVPTSVISIKELERLMAAHVDYGKTRCVDPSLLSVDELTRDRTFEADDLHGHPTGPQVAVTDWLGSDIVSFHQKYVDPLFSQLPECNGVRLVRLFSATPKADQADVWLIANFVRNPKQLRWVGKQRDIQLPEIEYEITDGDKRALTPRFNTIRFNTYDPADAVRLACLTAKQIHT
jgi:hypothetical protein